MLEFDLLFTILSKLKSFRSSHLEHFVVDSEFYTDS